VRRRVYAASEGAFGSLDAIASPAARDIETATCQERMVPLPREMLGIDSTRLGRTYQCALGATGIIQPEDIDAAISRGIRHTIPQHLNVAKLSVQTTIKRALPTYFLVNSARVFC
jgi:hypothetical protein